jgi:hypothetical protein
MLGTRNRPDGLGDDKHPHPYAAIRRFGFKLGRAESPPAAPRSPPQAPGGRGRSRRKRWSNRA